jgi:amylosucrase
VYNHFLHQRINRNLQESGIDLAGRDNLFYTRFVANAASIDALYREIYGLHIKGFSLFDRLITTIANAYKNRSKSLREKDELKMEQGHWFLSQEIAGMSLYVDRFAGDLSSMQAKLPYLKSLGVNFLHLMPLFKSPEGESDGGYAVSDFRKVDDRFGTIDDLQLLQKKMQEEKMYLMLDIVLNHTSNHHEWAVKAQQGDQFYQDFFYMYPDRNIPDQFDAGMPEVFPESSPRNFTFDQASGKWVMTVFHHYQWDLNFTNPHVFIAMLDTIFYYANLGVDVLRIDAPAFIWKQIGTTCQNLPQAHTLLRLIKQCVQVAAPGMAILGEAIVAPSAIMKYFGTGLYTAKECDIAYNATHMALQWDALATGNCKVMMSAQHELLQKPYGTTWLTYTRCHDDIGFGYEDYMIAQAGYRPQAHRQFLMEYYSGSFPYSPAKGALFSFNPKTGDARISGTLAALCGLEKAIQENDTAGIDISVQKIIMMQAHSFFLGGIPMLFYGDEAGYINDYSYQEENGKNYDNRWMHRPVINWEKNRKVFEPGTVEERIFSATKKLLQIRKKHPAVGDYKNLVWLTMHNIHVAGYLRTLSEERLYCIFNFSPSNAYLTWYAFKEHGHTPDKLIDLWSGKAFTVGRDEEFLELPAYGFYLLTSKQ